MDEFDIEDRLLILVMEAREHGLRSYARKLVTGRREEGGVSWGGVRASFDFPEARAALLGFTADPGDVARLSDMMSLARGASC